MSTQLQTPEATRQSINYVYRNDKEEVTLEWVTDDPAQDNGGETALTLFEIGFTHTSEIPASIADFRKPAK